MEKVSVKILSNTTHRAFRDTTVGGVYQGFLIEPYENCPRAWTNGMVIPNDNVHTLAIIDDSGDDVAVDFDDLVGVVFEVLEEDTRIPERV